MIRSWPWGHFALVSVLLAGLLFTQSLISSGMERPDADQLRYSNYSINLANHGVFGLSPDGSLAKAAPGNANAPLYPLFVAILIKFDAGLQASLLCALENVGVDRGCPADFGALVVAQYTLALLCLLLLWSSCWLMFGNPVLASGVALLAGLSGIYAGYAEKILTEILLLPLFAAVQLCLLLLVQSGRIYWALLIGLLMGLLTLTRPEGLHLTLLMAVVLVLMALLRGRPGQLRLIAAGLLVFIITLSPWLVRNQLQFGSPSLTTGGYGETILAYRLSFNRMTDQEWATAFVYWLPDFGDKVAQNTLPEPHYRRLISDNPDSFIATAKADILQPALDSMPREAVLGYWLKNEIIGKPLSHFRASLPIFWRGIWVAKYWGIIGLVSYVWLLFKLQGRQRTALLWFSLPAWLLVMLHAGISINIPRYNLPLVPVYAVGWGWVVMKLFHPGGISSESRDGTA